LDKPHFDDEHDEQGFCMSLQQESHVIWCRRSHISCKSWSWR